MLDGIKRNAVTDIADNKLQYLLLIFFLVVGLTAGTFTVNNMQSESKNALCEFTAVILMAVKKAELNLWKIFINAFFVNALYYALLAWFSMMSVGIVFIVFIMVIKGFCFGFTLGVLSIDFFGGGFWSILTCLIIPNVTFLACLCKAGALSINQSANLFKCRHIPSTAQSRLKDAAPHFKRLGFVFLVSIVGVIAQTFFAPALIKI